MLTARTDALPYVEAARVERGPAFRCRDCGAPVILRRAGRRVAHFAHRPDAACGFGGPMSAAHLAAQQALAAALRARGLTVELEAPLVGEGGVRRIDVLAWPPDRPEARVAIEVQASDLTGEGVALRTASYQALGLAPLWLRLLDFGRFPAVQTLPFRGTIWIERYPAKAWERWAHDHLGGRLWFMDSGTGHVWRGLFVAAHRRRDRGRISGDGGEAPGRGADWTEAVQWVDLELDGPFDLTGLRLRRASARGPDQVERRYAAFAIEGEARDATPAVRVMFQPEVKGASRRLETRVGDTWIPTAPEGANSDWRIRRAPRRQAITQR
jgi:predicted RNA-binding Zn-ribbon protein involved in translation (DUF1610 family)